jgi:transposase
MQINLHHPEDLTHLRQRSRQQRNAKQRDRYLSKALRLPENITLLHLPPYSPELNPVERLWAYLKSHYLNNRAYEHYDDLFKTRGMAWNQPPTEQLCSICHTEWIPRKNQ